MVIVGIKNGVVDMCVSINPDDMDTVHDMYPEHLILAQVADETIGWIYDGVSFTAPTEG